MQTSFYSPQELAELGLASCGKNVLLSRKTSIFRPDQVRLGNHVRIDDFCILSGSITIGNRVHISAYVALYGSEGITIGDYCNISTRTTIFTLSDDYLGNGMVGPMVPLTYRKFDARPVVVEPHVVVGAGSVVLPGTRIGMGAAIGALSLVNASCEPWRVYAGIPARAKKERRRDIILKHQAALEREEAESESQIQ
jgi:galactoside O-acetyltransferase